MLSSLLLLATVQAAGPATQPQVPPPAPHYPGSKSAPLQFEQPPKKTGRCAGGGYDDFDFFVGSWDVHNVDEEREVPFGKMDVEWVNEGCALLQRWTAKNDYSLVSVLYFEPHLAAWRKRTVMPDTGPVEMVGEAVEDAMVLTGQRRLNGLFRIRTYLLRNIYSPNADGTITLQTQASNDQGLTWADSSTQIYRPRNTDQP